MPKVTFWFETDEPDLDDPTGLSEGEYDDLVGWLIDKFAACDIMVAA